jgi:hypothetical protein
MFNTEKTPRMNTDVARIEEFCFPICENLWQSVAIIK